MQCLFCLGHPMHQPQQVQEDCVHFCSSRALLRQGTPTVMWSGQEGVPFVTPIGQTFIPGNSNRMRGDGLTVLGGSGWRWEPSCAPKSGQHCTAAQGRGESPSLGVLGEHRDGALGDVGSGMGWGWTGDLRGLFQPHWSCGSTQRTKSSSCSWRIRGDALGCDPPP